MEKPAIEELIVLRRYLHQNPELSGQEFKTSKYLQEFIAKFNPTEIISNLANTGFAVVYDFGGKGTTIGIRCELDALPIHEMNNDLPYKSTIDGISHKCGHDGHMAILIGVAQWLSQQQFILGRVILLFQPAEETGAGAYEVMKNTQFSSYEFDYFFSLHNLPKEPLHSIVFNEQGFSAEVQSFIISLKGKESHASEPEYGVNPANSVARIIDAIGAIEVKDVYDHDFKIITPVHINLGQKSYGISPANAELHYTTRAWLPSVMDNLKESIENIVAKECQISGLSYDIKWIEYFPAIINHPDTNKHVLDAVRDNGLQLITKAHPMKFGEDFGWFSKQFKTTMFGLGSGLDSPALHNADYDFPDEIIHTGITMFTSIIENILKENNI